MKPHARIRKPGFPIPHRNAGFTLIEVLLAVFIASLILVGVYGVLSRTLTSKKKAEEHAELYAQGRETVLRMAD